MEKKYATAREMLDEVGIEKFREISKQQREEFCNTIGKIVPELQKEIKEKNTITIPIKDLAKKMGPKYESRNPTSFYWAAKLCLWDKGIHIEPKRKDHEKALLIRTRTPEDKMPWEKK